MSERPERPPRCANCVFNTPTVPYSGRLDAPVVIVGESPGEIEVAKRQPFIGDSGKLLRKAFPEGVDVNDILFTNAIQCYPPPKVKDAKKLADACLACRERLLSEITAYPRDVILAVGNPAIWALTNEFTLKVTQVRGQVLDSPYAKHGVVFAYHPAYVLRGGGTYKVFREDVRYAFRLREGERKHAPEYKPVVLDGSHTNVETLKQIVQEHKIVAADIETSGLNPLEDDILCVGLTVGQDEIAYIIPDDHLKRYSGIFELEGVTWIWHNGKFDTAFLNEAGIHAMVDEDTMLLSYSLNEAGGIHGLEDVAKDLLGAPDYKHMLKPYLKNKQDSYAKVPRSVLYEYLALDVGHTFESWRILRPKVSDDGKLNKLYTRILIPASDMLQEVERRGFFVDRDRLKENDAYYTAQIDEAYERVNKIVREAGYPDVNPNSPKQVAELLYDCLGLQCKYGTRNEWSADKQSLESITTDHPIIPEIIAYRKATKSRGTYVRGIDRVIQADGCVHSTYKLHGARTGRLSSSNPNMQNIPRDPRLRGTFIARPGYVLIDCDLDQAELRCLAALSGDPKLCEVYESDQKSLHKEVSEWLWGDNWKERYAIGDTEGGLTDPIYLQAYDEYMRTKALNFGIVYGRESFSIAEEFGVTTQEAQKWIDKWFNGFPTARDFIDACRRAPLQGRTLFTPFGRKKRFGAVSAGRLKGLQNEAANFPHQSVASDITLYTAIKIYRLIQQYGAYIVNLVHDSIVIECPDVPDIIDRVIGIVLPEMVRTPVEWGITRIPFKSDCKVGTRWGMGKKYEPQKVAA